MTDYIGEFLDAMRSAGIETSEDILPDGKIHRFSCNGRKDDTAGWYLFFGDGIPVVLDPGENAQLPTGVLISADD